MYKKFYVTGLQHTTATRYFRYYPCIMRSLIFPSKMWAKDAHYTQQNTVLSLSSHSAPALSHLSPHLFSFWVQHRCSAVVYLCGYSVRLLSLPLWAPVSFAAVSPAPGVGPGTSKVLSNIKGMNGWTNQLISHSNFQSLVTDRTKGNLRQLKPSAFSTDCTTTVSQLWQTETEI